jgi:hypothetical protein
MKTAVEWLENEFQEMCKDFGGVHSDFIVKFDQAKAMEKKQIKDAFFEGKNDGILMERYLDYKHITPDEYYNETFKSE